MYTNWVFGTVKCVLFIEVSSFQDVLNKGFHCSSLLKNPLHSTNMLRIISSLTCYAGVTGSVRVMCHAHAIQSADVRTRIKIT